MATFPSKKPIPQRTPLGCILKHWKDLGGDPLTQKQLIEYCNHWWPMYTLECGERRPENGTFIGKTCLKYGSEEDDIDLLVAPHRRWGNDQGDQNLEAENASAPPMEGEAEGFSLISGRTQGRRGEAGPASLQAPLREAVGNDGPVAVKVPFSITDLRSWKETTGIYQEDPERVAKVIETIIRTQDPDWNDLQVILDTLLDTEKKMVLNTARKQVERAHANGHLQGTVDQNFPSANPEWDLNQPGPRGMLTRYQKWILFGVRHAMPKAINLSKIYEVRQELNESPSAFMERLKVTARKYTNLDPEKPESAIQLASICMGQSAPDIRKKLQKLEGPESRDLGKMLEIAWTVYNNREKEKEMRQAQRDGKLLVVLTENNRRGRGRGRGMNIRERGFGRRVISRLAEDQCAICKEHGHWKKECPKAGGLDPTLQAIKLMTLDD
ncbi:hypothetical protein QYF61_025184 [Mycteria americana]|uniref:Core shell protein Gag P30 domain-containing protein n=1 Tax=Mycteria americana TaxID=33587 RepID=A0AAN7N8D8_MYCAM|nr:hypothetical protein QYF61_025184 [Mycteria americana]